MKSNQVGKNLLNQPLNKKAEAINATNYPLRINTITNTQGEKQLTRPQEKTKNKAESKITSPIYRYRTRGDGGCFFRALLANQQNDPSWLEARPLSDVYDWISQVRPLFAQSIRAALSSLSSQYNYHLQAAFILNYLDQQGSEDAEIFIDDFLDAVMHEDHFLLWDPQFIQLFLNNYFPEDITPFSIPFADSFIDAIYEGIARDLDAPINQHLPVYLRRTGGMQNYHYELVSNHVLFNGAVPHVITASSDAESPRATPLISQLTYQSSQNDGASFLRVLLTHLNQNADWMETRPLSDVYQWITTNSADFIDALSSAVEGLNLDNLFVDQGDLARQAFASTRFLEQMMQAEQLNLFNPAAILGFAAENSIELDPCQATLLVESLIKHLAEQQGFSPQRGTQDTFRLSNVAVMQPQPGDPTHYQLLVRGEPLAGAEPNQRHFVARNNYVTYPVKYDTDLLNFKPLHYTNACEGFFRGWLALTSGQEEPLSAEANSLGTHLSTLPGFKKAFATALRNVIFQVTGQKIQPTRAENAVNQILNNYFNQGQFDLSSLLQNQLTNLGLPLHLFDGVTQAQFDGLNEQLINQLAFELGYPIYRREVIEKNTPKELEYFILEDDGSYSFTALGNQLCPFGEPIDSDIYQQDIIDYPYRDDLAYYFENIYGEQINNPSHQSSKKKDSRHKKSHRNKRHARSNKSQHPDHYSSAQEAWEKGFEQEAKAAKEKNTRPAANLNEVTRRDGLFSRQDALNASFELLSLVPQQLNQSAEYLGYNTQPRARLKAPSTKAAEEQKPQLLETQAPEAEIKSAKAKPKKETTENKKETEKSTETTKSRDPFRFPEAEGMPVHYPKTSNEHEQAKEEYHRWHVRNKRRAGNDANPEDYLRLNIEEAYGEGHSNLYFEQLKTKLSAPAATDPSQNFRKLYSVAQEINSIRRTMTDGNRFFQDTLDIFMMRALDTDPLTRAAFSFYQQKTKEAIMKGHHYVDADLDAFYESSVKFQFSDPEKTISSRTDLFLAKILIAQQEGIQLDPLKLGLAWGELSVQRQVLQVHTDHQYTQEVRKNLIQERNSRVMQSIEAQMNRGLTQEAAKVRLKPVETPMSKLMSNGAPVTPKGQGACHLLSMAAAYELSTSSNDNSQALARILKRTQNLAEVSAADPATAHRLISGLSSLNDQLYQFTAAELGKSKQKVSSIDALMTKIQSSGHPIVVTYRDSGKFPHTLSISPIKAPGRTDPSRINSGFLVADTNLGFIPCQSTDSLKNILQLSAQRYLGVDVSTSIDYGRLSLSAFEFDRGIKSKLTFGMQSGVPTGPYGTHTRRGGDDYYSYRHVFGEEAPGWSLFAKAHETSSSSAWARLLPGELGRRAVQGDHNIGGGLKITVETSAQAAMAPKSDQILEQMRLLSTQKDVACSLGKCSLEINKYLEEDLIIKKTSGEGAKARPADVDVIYAELQFKPRLDSDGPFHPMRHRKPGPTPALELDTPPQVPSRSHSAQPKPKTKLGKRPSNADVADELTMGLKQLRLDTEEMDISPPSRPPPPVPTQERANPYRRAFDTRYQPEQEMPMDLSKKNNKPLPPVPRADGPAVPPRRDIAADYQPFSNKQAALKRSNALQGAAMVEGLLDGQPPAPPARKIAVARRHSPASASAYHMMDVDMAPAPPPRGASAVDNGPPIPARTGIEASSVPKTKLKQRGREFLQEKRRPAPAAPNDDIARGIQDAAKPVPLEPPNRNQNPAGAELDADARRILADIMRTEDPAVARLMSQTLEELRIQAERLYAVNIELEDKATGYLKSKGLNPDDWTIFPPLSDADSSLDMVYRGDDPTVTQRVRSMEVPKSFRQRLAGIKDNFSALKMRIESSPRYIALQTRMSQLAQSKGYMRFGRAMQAASKAMSVFNMYTLINEAKELKNLAAHYKVAFAMSAVDGIFDGTSLTVSGINSFAQLNGAASTNLKVVSQALEKVSMGLGLAASVGQTYAHMYSMGLAQTPLEFEVSAANTGFSTASVLLTGLMIGFPAAMPVVALFQFAVMGIQYAVIQAIIDKHMRADAAKALNERWESAEELFRFISQIGQASVEEVNVTQDEEGITTIRISPKAASAYIEITGNKVKIFHKSDAFSTSYQSNEFKEEVKLHQSYKSVRVGAPLIKLGKNDNERKVHIGIHEIKDSLARTSLNTCAPWGNVAELDTGQTLTSTNSWKRILDAETAWGQYKMKSPTRTDDIVNCLLQDGTQAQYTFKKQFQQYLEADKYLNNPPDVIILNEITPKTELISDLTHFHEDEHMKTLTTKHSHVLAASKRCKNKAQKTEQKKLKDEVCQAVANQRSVLRHEDLCHTHPSYEWDIKATSYLHPANVPSCAASSDKAKTDQLMLGYNFLVTDYDEHDRRTKNRGANGLHPIRKMTVSAIPTSVRLTQVPIKTKIDIPYKDDESAIKLIILPERISTGLMTKTLPYYAFDYGTEVNKDKATTLKVHKDSYDNIKTLMTYQLELVANQNTDLILSTGTKTEINEEDDSSGNREGRYTLTLISPNTPEKQQEKIEKLKTEKTKAESVLKTERPLLQPKQIKYEDKLKRHTDLQQALNSPVQRDNLFEDSKAAEREYKDAKREYEDSIKLIAGSENRISELEELIPAETAVTYKPITQLKTNFEYEPIAKTFTLEVNQDTKEYNNIHLKITDLRRNIRLLHQEPVEINGNKVNFGCVFDIDIEKNQPVLALNQIAPLSPTDVKLINKDGYIEQLKTQLIRNNPSFKESSFPNAMIIPMQLSRGDTLYVGENKNPADYTGHVMLFMDKKANQSSAVSVIYPKNSTQHEIDIYQDLRYLGEEKILSPEEVPQEYKKLYNATPEAQRKMYFLYDEKSRTLVKQFMNGAIRKEDIHLCAPNEAPRKFTGPANTTPIYQCIGDDQLDLLTTINECKSKQPDLNNLFTFIEQKQKNETLSPVLTILNPGIIEKNQTTPLWMEYIGGNSPALMLIEKPLDNKKVGVITRNLEHNYTIIAEEVDTTDAINKAKLERLNEERKKNNLPKVSEIKISSAPLLTGEQLQNIGENLIISRGNITKTISATGLNKTHNLAPNSTITAVLRNPEEGFIVETLDGVAFSVSDNLKERHILGTNIHYLQDNNITTVEEIKSAFNALEQKYGLADSAYIKMSSGDNSNSDKNEPIIFMSAENKEPLFIPKTEQLSERCYILASLALNGKTTSLTVADPESRTLTTVLEPSNQTNTTQSASLKYGLFKLDQDSISLSLRPTNSTAENSEVSLPYLPTQSLYLLPQLEEENHSHTKVTIPELMREQVKMITLVPPHIDKNGAQIGQTQQISLKSAPNKDIKAFTQKTTVKIQKADGSEEIKTAKRLLLAVPKFTLEQGENSRLKFIARDINSLSRDYTIINLFDPFDKEENLTNNFDECIYINDKALTHDELTQLVANATPLAEESVSLSSQDINGAEQQTNGKKEGLS